MNEFKNKGLTQELLLQWSSSYTPFLSQHLEAFRYLINNNKMTAKDAMKQINGLSHYDAVLITQGKLPPPKQKEPEMQLCGGFENLGCFHMF